MNYLVQFLLSLTDERVACHSGVFDHPELPLTMGQEDVANPGTQSAKDIVRTLPAVGSRGLKGLGKPCFPNSGDLFGSVNAKDPTPLQPTFLKILDGTTPAEVTAATQAAALSTPFTAATASATGSVAASGLSTQGPASGGGATVVALANQGGGGGGGGGGIAAPAIGTKGGTAKPGAGVTATAADLTVLPPPVPAPVFTGAAGDIKAFTLIGFIQAASVSNAACPNITAKRQWGGSATVNNIKVVIPCNTTLQMPAATLTWAELLPSSAGGVGSEQTTLTLQLKEARPPAVYPSTEIRVIGNIVAGEYIAGLVFISQQSLNTGSGVISVARLRKRRHLRRQQEDRAHLPFACRSTIAIAASRRDNHPTAASTWMTAIQQFAPPLATRCACRAPIRARVTTRFARNEIDHALTHPRDADALRRPACCCQRVAISRSRKQARSTAADCYARSRDGAARPTALDAAGAF